MKNNNGVQIHGRIYDKDSIDKYYALLDKNWKPGQVIQEIFKHLNILDSNLDKIDQKSKNKSNQQYSRIREDLLNLMEEHNTLKKEIQEIKNFLKDVEKAINIQNLNSAVINIVCSIVLEHYNGKINNKHFKELIQKIENYNTELLYYTKDKLTK